MELDPEEASALQEVQAVYSTACTPGWQAYILPKIREFVDEAHEDMIGAGQASDEVCGRLAKRWVQRVSLLRGIEKYIEQCENDRKRIIAEIDERKRQAEGVPLEY